MYYILFYKTISNYTNKRIPFRKTHLNLVEDLHKKGKIVLAGAFINPSDSAALVFKCDSIKEIHRFIEQDPYIQNGLITEWKLREWDVVIGND